jgi:hypothetical protein
MKRALLLSLCLIGLVHLSRAQEPFVYETATELTSVANLNADALPDVIIADRSTGAVRFGLANATGFQWTTQLTGVVPLDSMAVGTKTVGATTDVCAVTGSRLNAVELLTQNGSDKRLRITGHTLSGLAPRDGNADVTLANLIMSTSLPNQTILLANNVSTDSEAASKFTSARRSGNSIRLNASSRVSLMIDEAAHTAELFRTVSAPFPSITSVATLSNLPPLVRTAEVPIIQSTTVAAYHLAYWAPGATSFSLSRFNSFTILNQPTTWSFGTPFAISTNGFALGSVHFLAGTGTNNLDTLLLLVSADGTSARTVVLPAGGTTLTLRQSMTAPAGQTFTGALALANGSFYFLQGKNGRTTDAVLMSYNGSTHTANAPSTLPSLGGTRTQANVFTFTAEPLVNPDAKFIRSFKVSDWTVTATNSGGTLSVSAQPDNGPTSGLGTAATSSVSGAATTNFAVPNQMRPNVSLAVLGTGFGPTRPTLLIEPPSGRYKPLTNIKNETFFPIEFANAASMGEIYFRIDGGVWIKYDPSISILGSISETISKGRPLLTASGTIEAFGVPVGQLLIPTPTARNTYQLSAPTDLIASNIVDANNNGLSDAWEKTFGLTDPAGDADGDGVSNLDEYRGGTDPRNATSVPTPGGDIPDLFITSVASSGSSAPQVEIFWFSPRTDLILEASSTLQAPWTTISSSQITTTNQRHAHRHTLSTSARFFRLRQP